MCHCKRSVRIHVRICKLSIRILIRIWNELSLSIFYDWQVLLAYLLLNSFLWIRIRIWFYFFAFVSLYIVYAILYSILNSNTIYYIVSKFNYNVLFNTIRSRLLEPTLHFHILYPGPSMGQWAKCAHLVSGYQSTLENNSLYYINFRQRNL
jgi:hypothetical protein